MITNIAITDADVTLTYADGTTKIFTVPAVAADQTVTLTTGQKLEVIAA